MQRAVLTHGGASSNPQHKDGTEQAAQIAMACLRAGKNALEAVIQAVQILEDDPRFNAGTGSVLRADGTTIQMDAACMESGGQFGAVATITGVKNPILVARKVMDTPAILLAGVGATKFAYEQGFAEFHIQPPLDRLDEDDTSNKPLSNKPHSNKPNTDTVGAVAFDGTTFAAALSSGGLSGAMIGRVGDVPLIGCGLYCGPLGAIAATGQGEFIAKQLLAYRVYQWLSEGVKPQDAAKLAIDLYPASVDVGILVLSNNNYGINCKTRMASAVVIENI